MGSEFFNVLFCTARFDEEIFFNELVCTACVGGDGFFNVLVCTAWSGGDIFFNVLLCTAAWGGGRGGAAEGRLSASATMFLCPGTCLKSVVNSDMYSN
jgi:hypothetical protein